MGKIDPSVSISVRHFCSYPGNGGAGIAADRVVRGLIAEGVEAELWGIHPVLYAPYVQGLKVRTGLRASLDRRWRAWQVKRAEDGFVGQSLAGAYFFTDRSTHGKDLVNSLNGCRIIHFHWMSQMIDFLDTLRRLPEAIPVVWTLHDMNAFTGGCTYNLDCEGFWRDCGECPQQESGKGRREVALNHRRKRKALAGLEDRICIVTPSHWMAKQVGRSQLMSGFRCEVIANGIDQEIFHPSRRRAGRERMGIGAEEKVILFVAASIDNPLKGMALMREVLPQVEMMDPKVRVVVLGDGKGGDWPEGWQWLGSVTEEERLAEVYAGSDVLVVPSMADNFPNVIGEGLSCGLPVVASEVGGIPEMVRNGQSGRLFEKGSAEGLKRAIGEVLKGMPERREEWAVACRKLAEEKISLGGCARQHMELYESLL